MGWLSINNSVDDQSMDVNKADKDDPNVQSHNTIQESLYNKMSSMLEGLHMVLASSYLLHICCLLWLTAVVSSFFYFQAWLLVVISVLCNEIYTHVSFSKWMLTPGGFLHGTCMHMS